MTDSLSVCRSLSGQEPPVLKDQTILVTGAAGFIGTNLVQALSRHNQVIALDINKALLGMPMVVDITDSSWINQIGPVDFVFHLAAVVGVDLVSNHPIQTMDTEIFGMSHVIQYARQYKPKKIVYTSTSAVYGDVRERESTAETALTAPLSTYGMAKLLAELYLEELFRHHDIPYAIARIFNAYGPYQQEKMVISRFIRLALQGQALPVFGDGRQTRDFTYVADVVHRLERLANPTVPSGLYNIGTGRMRPLAAVARTVVSLCQSSSPVVLVPSPPHREKFEVNSRICDPAKIEAALGFSGWTPFEQGLVWTIAHFLSQAECQ